MEPTATSRSGSVAPRRTTGRTMDFDEFLRFEHDVFGEPLPIPEYDPFLIRYGEYRFVLDELADLSPAVVLDIGCEWNIFGVFMATFGIDVRAVDIDPDVWVTLERRTRRAEAVVGRRIPLSFRATDATVAVAPPGSVDVVVAVSALEHMFSRDGDGDVMALAAIAEALAPGGRAIVTVPMSNGRPFREVPDGDSQFGGPYRVYDTDALTERLLSNPDLECRRLAFLAQTTPDPRFDQFRFASFWTGELDREQRARWDWVNPMLASVFNPIVEADDEVSDDRLNTALVSFEKRT